jgi:hypothetical protein
LLTVDQLLSLILKSVSCQAGRLAGVCYFGGVFWIMAQLSSQGFVLDLIDPRTAAEVAAVYRSRRALGVSDFAAHHAALMVLWDKLPGQPFRALAEAVSSIVAPFAEQRQAA